MPATVSGRKTQPITQPEERGTQDIYGVDMITLVEEIPTELFPRQMRKKYSAHPRFPNMGISKSEWARGPAGKFYRVTYTYEGFLSALPEPTYTLNASTSEEPIQLHPDFSKFAGKPSAPKNGAVFIDPETGKPTKDDRKGVFREFSISGKEFAGIESYLSPGATWTEVSFSTTRPNDLGSLAEIDPPSGPNPTFSGKRNWIYSGVEYTRRGGIYEIRKTWLLSGKGGWNSTIYGS